MNIIFREKTTGNFYGSIVKENGSQVVDKENKLPPMYDKTKYIENGENDKYVRYKMN